MVAQAYVRIRTPTDNRACRTQSTGSFPRQSGFRVFSPHKLAFGRTKDIGDDEINPRAHGSRRPRTMVAVAHVGLSHRLLSLW